MIKLTFRGGIHPSGHKELTEDQGINYLVSVEKVYLPLIQHIGAPCVPLVQVGDVVKKGQKIAEGKGFVTAPVHASVSGEVIAIEEIPTPAGGFTPCIVIQNDGKDEWYDAIQPQQHPESLTPAQLREIVQGAGIVGLGGAAFPTHVKYAIPEGKGVKTVIINGIECEPYLTSDYRLMLEDTESIIKGLQYIMKMVDCSEGIIAIEDNKPDAYQIMAEAVKAYPQISVVACKTKYPQGSEKHLIKACTGKELSFGKLPLDLGVIVNNVGTAAAICQAVEKGIPLVSRVVTVSGDGINKPGNYLVPIGTLIRDLVAYCGGYKDEVAKIIAGGPMMGKAIFTDNMPVIKGTSGLLIMKKEVVRRKAERNCVRCAKCVDACPLKLLPTNMVSLAKQKNWAELEENKAMQCIECGSCSYVCPANIPIIQYIRRGKQEISAARAKSTN